MVTVVLLLCCKIANKVLYLTPHRFVELLTYSTEVRLSSKDWHSTQLPPRFLSKTDSRIPILYPCSVIRLLLVYFPSKDRSRNNSFVEQL